MANASVMIVPEADHVNTSICPVDWIEVDGFKFSPLGGGLDRAYLVYLLYNIYVCLRLFAPNRPRLRISLKIDLEPWQCLRSVPIGIVS